MAGAEEVTAAAKCQPSHYVNFEKCMETVVHEEPDFIREGFKKNKK